MSISNESDVKSFILNCRERPFSLKITSPNKAINDRWLYCWFRTFKFVDEPKLRVDSIGGNAINPECFIRDAFNYGAYGKSTYPELMPLNDTTVDQLISFMKSSRIIHPIHCNMYTIRWRDILSELVNIGMIKYHYVAEDSRSGANLEKFTEINGRKVDHNTHQDCISRLEAGQFYGEICDLYIQFLSRCRARESVLCLILARKFHQSDLNVLPIEIVLMIAKCLWNTRNDKEWCRDNIKTLMNNDQYIDVKY